MGETRKVQLSIIDSYESDMIKYAPAADKPRIRECFESIPKQLARDYKKFTYSVIRPNAKGRDYAGSLQWIEDAGIIHRCYNTEITELPLEGVAIKDQFKVYMADTGLLISILEEGTAWSIMQGDLGAYKGAIYENLMADILGKMGRKLYYFHKDSGLEIDFLMRYKNECVLVECKARTGNAKSTGTILKHPEKYHVNHAIKCGDYNIGRQGALLTIPFYMAFLLKEL
jgi:predicted AAA+ superfamily ATPase